VRACVEQLPDTAARVAAASRTECSVEVASMFLRLWCNAYARRLKRAPDPPDGSAKLRALARVRQQFLCLTNVCPGLRWQEDTAGAPQSAGTRLECHALAALLAKAAPGADGVCAVPVKEWSAADPGFSRANCFV